LCTRTPERHFSRSAGSDVDKRAILCEKLHDIQAIQVAQSRQGKLTSSVRSDVSPSSGSERMTSSSLQR
jgi:hypothetical protein